MTQKRPHSYHARMDHAELATWWSEAFTEGTWWAPWRDAIEGLTAEQAAWKPAPGRHSIWQIVGHMTHWHEYFVHRNLGGEPIDEQELEGLNWQEINDASETAWASARQRFADSHARVRDAMAHGAPPKPQLDMRYLYAHDCYHVGQIMYIRSLIGLPALES